MSLLKHSTPLSAKFAFIALSILTFFLSTQVSLTAYIDSSYLTHTILNTPAFTQISLWENPDQIVGILYTLASLLTIVLLVTLPKILRRVGNYRFTVFALCLHTVLLLGLGFFDTALMIIPIFIIEASLISILYFNLDVFLEHYSNDKETGLIRGSFMTIGSLAWLLPPFFGGYIVEHFGFSSAYLIGAIIIFPTIFLMIRYFSNFEDLEYDPSPLIMSRETAKRYPNVTRILWSAFFVQFFYSWMIIYAPIYFHNTLGFSYEEFGMILMVALTAFVIFPAPLGWLADHVLGEKELLITGFFLMGITSFAIPYVASLHVGMWWWALLFFVGRSGAATVDAMVETYFFKQIDGHDAAIIGYYRRARPIAFIIAPLFASILLGANVITFTQLFTILGFVMLIAMYTPLRLKDTL